MSDLCGMCDEEVVPPDGVGIQRLIVQPMIWIDGVQRPVHPECGVRSALGGIGHLEDHAYWCLEMHDPDGGRTFHQSAIEVMAWVEEHGM